jgi:dolichol kinase
VKVPSSRIIAGIIDPDTMAPADLLKFRAELKRKAIHLSCSLLPLLYYFYLSREQIIAFSSLISIIFLTAEFLRFRYLHVQKMFSRFVGPLLRESEREKTLTGATYLFLSATITFIVFEKMIAIPSVLVLTIADSFAAIVGKMIDSIRFFRKTLAGSLTFFITGTVIIHLVLPEIGYMVIVVMLPVTLLESAVEKINDNLLLPVSTGIILYLVFGLGR